MSCFDIKNNKTNTFIDTVTVCRSYNDHKDDELLIIDSVKNAPLKCTEHGEWTIINAFDYNDTQCQKLFNQQLIYEAKAKVNGYICNSEIHYLEEPIDNGTDSSLWGDVIGLISKIPSFWA